MLMEALKEFFDYLKESGLYDNSVIVMYGDHYGISENIKKPCQSPVQMLAHLECLTATYHYCIHVPGIDRWGNALIRMD